MLVVLEALTDQHPQTNMANQILMDLPMEVAKLMVRRLDTGETTTVKEIYISVNMVPPQLKQTLLLYFLLMYTSMK